jgi:hypothetical protein
MAAVNAQRGGLKTPLEAETTGRLSYVSGASQTHPKDAEGGFAGIKTPDDHDAAYGEFEGGALREGGAVHLLSREAAGLLFQYAAVGLTYGMLPAVIYPFLQQYLNASGQQTTTASTLVTLPWSFKAFYGILSDCFPIFGLRRKPYILIGWVVTIAMLAIMAGFPQGEPYYTVSSDRNISPEDYTPEIEARINYDAPSQAGKYVIMMFFAAVGYVLSDVCADSIVVEFAQREPVAIRGRTQSAIYGVRTVVVILGKLLVGFCFNGEEYGGDFSWSLSFSHLMIIIAVCTAPILPISWLFIQETPQPKVEFRKYMADLWEFFQQRAAYQVIAFSFFHGVISSISYTASSPIQSYLAGVTPINETISDALTRVIFLFGLYATARWGLHWNWRWMTLWTGVFTIVIDAICAMFTVWDVYRSQWFWLGLPLAVELPYTVAWIILNYVTVELASVGNEAFVYGVMTTVGNVASPFSTSLTLVIDAPFNLTSKRVQIDDDSIRWDLTYAIIIMYAATAASWVFLPLLPKQKAETQELRRSGGKSKILGGITIAYLLFAIFWSVMTNIMGIFDSTSCLVIAGGSGC